MGGSKNKNYGEEKNSLSKKRCRLELAGEPR
jgi:hypothetical protein